MELRHLKYFVAVAEEQNITRAAARLHVSQPPLSRQIRDLEEELGVALFQRSARAIRLSTAGRLFLEEARAVLRRAEEAVRAVRLSGSRDGGELNIAYAPSLTVEILPRILREFQEKSPKVRTNLHDLSTDAMITGMRQHTLDVALMVHPGQKGLRGLEFEALYSYPMCVAVHPAHPLASGRTVNLADLASERLIAYSRQDYPEYHERLRNLFETAGVVPEIAEERDSSTALIASVEAGRGIALVPASLACLVGPRLKLLRIVPAPEPLKIGLVRRKGTVSHVVQGFFQAARACRTASGKKSNAIEEKIQV